jgi:hypothetical protein
MRSSALPVLAALALIFTACGGSEQAGDAGRDGSGDGSARGGTTGRGGTGGAGGGTGGSATGGAIAGSGGSTGGGTGGSGGDVGSGGSMAGSGGSGTGGSATGSGGATGGSGGSTAGTGGSAGRGGTGGSGGRGGTGGTGGSAGRGGTGGSAGSAGRGGTGGSAGRGGSGGSAGSAGRGGTGGTGGSAGSAGRGGTGGSAGSAGRGGSGGSAGSGGSTGTGGSTAGTGGTVPCTSASTCPGGADTDCQHKTCVSNFCGLAFTAANTPVTAQTAGDCHRNVCDGSGGVMSANDDTDKPVDGNVCTGDVCTNGTPSNPNLPVGTMCSTAPDFSKACDGSAACNTLTFRVVRIGNGGAALSSGSTAVAVEEWRTTGTTPLSTINLPIAASGNNKPLTMSGSATSEGCLSLSADGHYLALAGYASAPGTAMVKSTTVDRVVGTIDAVGTVNTALSFSTGDNGDNVRAATTFDNIDVWISGAGSPNSNGGIWYTQRGTPGEVQIVATPNTTRCVAIFGNQLYGSSGSGAFANVFSIGFGTPTTLPAMGPKSLTTTANPYGFAMFDLPGGITGMDTMYVADETAGLQKWTYEGSAWTLKPTTFSVSGSPGFRGVAGYAVGSTVTLLATTAEASMNRLVVFVDDGGATVNGTVISTAAANTIYRGVAVSPHF